MVERERKGFARDQLAIADLFVAAPYDAIGDFQLGHIGAEVLCREIEQRVLGQRASIANLHAADLNREATKCRPLIGRECGVALHDFDTAERHLQLFGRDLRQCGTYARAEIDFAGIDRHRAHGIDGQKRIDRGERQRLSYGSFLREYVAAIVRQVRSRRRARRRS